MRARNVFLRTLVPDCSGGTTPMDVFMGVIPFYLYFSQFVSSAIVTCSRKFGTKFQKVFGKLFLFFNHGFNGIWNRDAVNVDTRSDGRSLCRPTKIPNKAESGRGIDTELHRLPSMGSSVCEFV